MTVPIYQIIAGSADVTAGIAKRFLSMSVTDEAGIKSDAVTIVLDDRDSAIAVPARDVQLSVRVGTKAAGLAFMGLFFVDEVELSGPERTMTIRAKAARMSSAMKAPVTRSWDATTLGAIARSIAAKHGTEALVAAELDGIAIPHIDQSESDFHLLTRLARENGGLFKPANGNLVIVKRGGARTVSGQSMTATEIRAMDVTSWSATIADRGRYGSVTAEYHDHASATRKVVIAGAGTPAYQLRNAHTDEAAAGEAAKAKLASLNRSGDTLQMTTRGHPHVRAETPITVTGVRVGVDGRWIVSRVTHSIAGTSDFKTSLEAEAPN